MLTYTQTVKIVVKTSTTEPLPSYAIKTVA